MPLSFGFLSTYPPTQCGLATFTTSLAGHLGASGDRIGVVRLVDAPEAYPSVEVVHHLVRGSRGGGAAAHALGGFDVAVVQHEFGIYGGFDGDEILDVLDRLRMPVIVVAHTVLTAPTRHQREVFEHVLSRADAVVTMSRTAHSRIRDHYPIDPAKSVIIPHGAPPAVASTVTGRDPASATILTWGLLGPGKGIETVIDALPRLQSLDPPPRYHVVGQTHPRVFARDGEAYRHALMARAIARGVAGRVRFRGDYLDTATLTTVIAGADVVVLPYESSEQVTSGVLIEAVAAGKPVVATAFPHAVELLAGGAGLVVPHNDPPAMAAALRRVLTEPRLAATMAGHAVAVAPQLRWPAVAQRYRALAAGLIATSTALVP